MQLLWWGVQFLLIWKFDFRATAPHIATAFNLTTYYLATLLFGASFISLLDNSYINRRQTTTDIIKYSTFLLLVWGATLCTEGWLRNGVLMVCAVLFFADTASASGIVMFIYIFASFQNYLVHFEDVENAMDVADNSTDDPIIDSLEMPDCNYVPLPKEMQSDLKSALEQWVKEGGYRQPKGEPMNLR